MILKCSSCKLEKDESEFHKLSSCARGYHYVCKSCRNTERQERQRALYEDIYFYLLDKGCEVCGETDPLKLEFDHKNSTSKTYTISNICTGNYSENTVWNEIYKCRILCSNCHKVKTHKERNTIPYQ